MTVTRDRIVFIPFEFYNYACETVNHVNEFLIAVSDRVGDLGAMIDTKVKTNVDFQQSFCNFLLMQSRPFIATSQRLDDDKQARVNNKYEQGRDQTMRGLLPGSAPQAKGLMGAATPGNDNAEVVEVLNENNTDDGLCRGLRKRQEPPTFQ